jgi:hypothetical protein
MKVRDRKGALNLKFLKSLERIEKKGRERKRLKYDGESQNPWEKK